MNTVRSFIINRGNNKKLSSERIYAQQNLKLIYVVLLTISMVACFFNIYYNQFFRLFASTVFLFLFFIGLIINSLGMLKLARAFLIIAGFGGVVAHNFMFGAGSDLEYLAMLFPIGTLLLTDKKWFYKFSLLISFLLFLGIKILHVYHEPLFEISNTFFLKILVGGTIIWMSFLILQRFKNEVTAAQYRAEESLAKLQVSISALKESESRYKAVFDNAFDGILIVDLDAQKLISCNEQMLNYFGMEAGGLREENMVNFLREKGGIDLNKDLNLLKEEGKIQKKSRIYPKRGRSIYADITCVLLPPPNNQLVVVLFKDISTEIIAKNKMLEANEELKNFAHAASHDLKEPLRMIRSFGQLLQKKEDIKASPQSQEFLGYIVDASTRMTHLVNDLLEYSTATNSIQQESLVDLEDVLHIAMKNIQLQAVENEVIIYSSPLPKIVGNTSFLVQIFQNILSNAIKFRRPGIIPEIRINALTNKDFHLISIRDNGIGIAPEYHDQIFGVFKRLHSKADYDGSGIGLATCKKIVEKKGGKIWVESDPGFGTSFHFTWPISTPINQENAEKEAVLRVNQ